MKIDHFKAMFAAAALLFIGFVGVSSVMGQDSPQKAVASKTAKFESVARTDVLYTGALDAHNLAGGEKLVGKDGAFKGTVTKVFTTRGGGLLILNFDRDYKTAMTAVLNKSDFSKFPDMSQLEGKEIVASGKYIDFHGAAEIALTDPKQIAVVK